MPNNQVYVINTSLTPGSSLEQIIHYGRRNVNENGNVLSCGGGNSSSSPEMETRISQSQYIYTIYPWLCKKGDYLVVWILNT